MRFVCRYGYQGQIDKIVATAYAKQLSLYNFSEQVREFVKNNPDKRSLDGLFADATQAKTLTELVAEIQNLIGLHDLKLDIEKIIAEAQYEKEQRRMGRKVASLNYHMLFLGNPGTGKTLVARIIGQIFWALELRSSQNVVEIAYSDIISSSTRARPLKICAEKFKKQSAESCLLTNFISLRRTSGAKRLSKR